VILLLALGFTAVVQRKGSMAAQENVTAHDTVLSRLATGSRTTFTGCANDCSGRCSRIPCPARRPRQTTTGKLLRSPLSASNNISSRSPRELRAQGPGRRACNPDADRPVGPFPIVPRRSTRHGQSGQFFLYPQFHLHLSNC
jgi:hypothetical protein